MNERIRELAEHCIGSRPYNTFDYEKFAELIVGECADIASINQHQYHNVGKYVLEHFGVK